MSDERPPPAPEEPPEEGMYIAGQHLPPARPVEDRLVAVAAVLTGAGALAFGLGLVLGAPRTVYGTGLAVSLLALAYGFYRYSTGSYPEILAVEPRPTPPLETDEDVPPVDVPQPRRRSVLGWLLAGGAALLGLSFAAPVASLGPVPGDALRRTMWRQGTRLVTALGTPVRPGDILVGSVVTAYPEDAIDHERSAAIVVRIGLRGPQPPTKLDWVVDDTLVAYSKICTHAGCPVGLFRERDDALFCPCHQATFDAARAAEPTFGPAARRLPQLPLGLDDDGFLVALGDFPEQIGPGFGWLPRADEEREA